MKTFEQLVDLAATTKSVTEHLVNLSIQVDGSTWNCYMVSVAHRDLLFCCDQGTATYLIDSYDTRNVAELYDWETN